MGKVELHVYHVKFKLIPENRTYKTSFIQGVVVCPNQQEAVELGKKKVIEALNKDGFSVDVKIQSVVKLRKDFFLWNDNKNS